ncbi:hypothetical protein [Georgenia faecalis]|uniref:WXG100 family type VII secretion target n=1 Tax=Georgenia faecalis TaxID=2483799 RepID=A0ABV9DBL6_9MICO|nr:hypothetical protein [Georgenia faecalis]
MSDPTLVVSQGTLEAVETAMTTAHDQLLAEVTALRQEVRTILVAWSTATESRQAQLEFDAALQRDVDAVAAALVDVRSALVKVREDARSAEIDNVAILD